MNKHLKKTCAVVMAVATSASLAGVQKLTANNLSNVKNTGSYAYADVVTGVMTISSYKKSVVYGDEFTLPTAKMDGVDITDVKVTAPTGATVTVSEGKFKVDAVGTYTIKYTSGDYAGEVTFVATMPTYSISYTKNSARLLPSKVGVNYAGDIYVPEYKVTDRDGEDATEDVVVSIVVKKGENTFTVDDNGKVVFGETALAEGTYYVTYTVKTADGDYITSDTLSFNCVDEDNAYKADSELKLSYTKDKTASVNLGKTVELPALTATLEGDKVDIYYTVEVYKNGTEKVNADTEVHDTTVLKKNDNGVYEFTAKELANYYTVKYTAKDAIGHTANVEFAIETVEDTLDPTPWVVEAYDTEDVGDLKNVDYKLPSYFESGNNAQIKILPIYASDLGTFGFGEYQLLQRQIKNSSSEVLYTDSEDPNKTLVFNYTGDEADLAETEKLAKDSEGNVVTLKAGTYYAHYTAKDAAGRSKTTVYKFVVNKDYVEGKFENEYVDPTIKFNDEWYESIDKGETIEFGKPTFSDKYDERLETSVSYQYYDVYNNEVGEEVELELGSNSKYTVDTKDAPATAYSVKIIARATNDSGRTTTETQTINLKSEITGTVAPSVYDVDDYVNTANQGEEIEIPMVVFSDDIVDTLNADVEIVCTNGDDTVTYEANNLLVARVGNYMYTQGAKFVAATAGNYQVAVKAVDAAGNVAIKFFNYTVAGSVFAGELTFTNVGLSDANVSLELGDSYKLPTAKIAGENADDYAYEVQLVSGPTGALVNNDKFTATKVGEYKLRYVMYEKTNARGALDGIVEDQTIEFTITVEDTTAPEVYVNWQYNAVYDDYTKLLLPMFSAEDRSNLDMEKSTITIECSKTSSIRTIKFADMAEEYAKGEDGTMYYNFNRDAEYTVTYKAVDVYGNSAQKKFTVKVGDLDAPILSVEDGIMEESYKVGDEISIDLTADNGEFFKIAGADDEAKVENIVVSLTCNGTTVANLETASGKYRFTLENAGSYELTFYVKDEADNKSNVVTKTFEIEEQGSETVDSTKVVGTILIVISVVVLAGVVVYFIVSKRKMDKLYK